MDKNRKRIVVNYENLSEELKEQVKLSYPRGFSQHLITFINNKGKKISALRFETFEKIYLIRMSNKAAELIIKKDNDYDDYGNLKKEIREKYTEEHFDKDYLAENENYEEDYSLE